MPDGKREVAPMQRAYSLLTIKSVNEDQRVITGIASTVNADRMGDVVEPKGGQYKLPLPLLYQHNTKQPIGQVTALKVGKDGIEMTAKVAKDIGVEFIEEAWKLIKAGLVRGLSIGFSPIEYNFMKDGGIHFEKWELYEISAVTIPANAEASILNIKSADQSQRAASGALPREGERLKPPGASGTKQPAASGFFHSRKETHMLTLQELRESRTQKAARQTELMELRKAEDRRFTTDEAAEFDGLTNEVAELDDDIRVKQFEATNAAAATPARGKSFEEGSRSRGGFSFTRKADPEDKFKGQSFTRILIAKALAMSSGDSAANIAQQRWGKSNPNLVNIIKATVAGGGTGSGEWGAELAASDAQFTGDFVEYLYARTVFDQLDLRAIPSRVHVKGQDGAFTGYWVGESKGIPASKGDYSDVELTPLKVAGLAVISMELLEDSQPSAEMLVRDGLVEASSQRVDQTFLSATAASAGVSPAGILNGVTAFNPSGTDLAAIRADLQQLLYPFVTGKMASGIKLVMNPATAMALGMMYGSLDQLAFPDLNENGGSLNKRPVIVGDNVTPGNIIAIRTQDVWRIGDSGVRISMSREATIEQRDDPTGATDTPVGVTTTGLTNMFQEESVAFKVVRRINFQKRRSTAVQFIQDAEYGGVVS